MMTQKIPSESLIVSSSHGKNDAQPVDLGDIFKQTHLKKLGLLLKSIHAQSFLPARHTISEDAIMGRNPQGLKRPEIIVKNLVANSFYCFVYSYSMLFQWILTTPYITKSLA